MGKTTDNKENESRGFEDVALTPQLVPAHIVLQRLSSASPSDRVTKALTALGRIVKTVFILRYIHDDKIRRRVESAVERSPGVEHDQDRQYCWAAARSV